jgi:ABC-2 type transport system ATP-binding protein
MLAAERVFGPPWSLMCQDVAPEYAIETQGLSKRFGDVEAVAGVDLRAASGTVLGVLGPNGAGKTTIVRILTTLLTPDAGSARVAGLDVVAQAAELRSRIGLAGQYAAVDENLNGRENLDMVGRLYHLGRDRSGARADELLERFDLTDAGKRLVRTYSGGMRRRLDLAAALVAEPPVLFLDEPTTGLDPRSRLALWETIEQSVAGGTTVLLTTQYLDEADRLADQIAVIDHGRVIAEGSSDELKDRVGGERLEVTLETPDDAARAIEALAPMCAGEPPTAEGGVVSMPVSEHRGAIARAVRALDERDVAIDDVVLRRPTLDDVFMRLTGRAAEDAVAEEDAA